DRYFKDLEQKVQSWFDKVREMAESEGISELKTETFTGYWVHNRLCYCYGYRFNSHWDQGENWIKKILYGECGKRRSTACSLFCLGY
ncbi:MAG: hypothetical protein WBZ36_23410, partial [Candidatus Nitrosopolaris sp.]